MRTQNEGDVGSCRFECNKCPYKTDRPCDWYRHCNTKRHKTLYEQDDSNMDQKEQIKPLSSECELHCDTCGRTLGSRTSMWRHRKKCTVVPSATSATATDRDLVALLASATQALQDATDINKTLVENTRSCNLIIGNNTNNSTNNNIFNINVFLNENCGNAMSIQRFADSLSIALDDLQRDTASALTNTVIKNLQPLSLRDRPVHCKASSEWYIKDDATGWQRNTGERLLAAAAFGIQRNWLKEFEREYPRWMENEKLRDMYVKIAGTSSSDISERDKEAVLKAIGGACKLDTTTA